MVRSSSRSRPMTRSSSPRFAFSVRLSENISRFLRPLAVFFLVSVPFFWRLAPKLPRLPKIEPRFTDGVRVSLSSGSSDSFSSPSGASGSSGFSPCGIPGKNAPLSMRPVSSSLMFSSCSSSIPIFSSISLTGPIPSFLAQTKQ